MAWINAVISVITSSFVVTICQTFKNVGMEGGSGRKGEKVVLRTASAEFMERRRNLKTTS